MKCILVITLYVLIVTISCQGQKDPKQFGTLSPDRLQGHFLTNNYEAMLQHPEKQIITVGLPNNGNIDAKKNLIIQDDHESALQENKYNKDELVYGQMGVQQISQLTKSYQEMLTNPNKKMITMGIDQHEIENNKKNMFVQDKLEEPEFVDKLGKHIVPKSEQIQDQESNMVETVVSKRKNLRFSQVPEKKVVVQQPSTELMELIGEVKKQIDEGQLKIKHDKMVTFLDQLIGDQKKQGDLSSQEQKILSEIDKYITMLKKAKNLMNESERAQEKKYVRILDEDIEDMRAKVDVIQNKEPFLFEPTQTPQGKIDHSSDRESSTQKQSYNDAHKLPIKVSQDEIEKKIQQKLDKQSQTEQTEQTVQSSSDINALNKEAQDFITQQLDKKEKQAKQDKQIRDSEATHIIKQDKREEKLVKEEQNPESVAEELEQTQKEKAEEDNIFESLLKSLKETKRQVRDGENSEAVDSLDNVLRKIRERESLEEKENDDRVINIKIDMKQVQNEQKEEEIDKEIDESIKNVKSVENFYGEDDKEIDDMIRDTKVAQGVEHNTKKAVKKLLAMEDKVLNELADLKQSERKQADNVEMQIEKAQRYIEEGDRDQAETQIDSALNNLISYKQKNGQKEASSDEEQEIKKNILNNLAKLKKLKSASSTPKPRLMNKQRETTPIQIDQKERDILQSEAYSIMEDLDKVDQRQQVKDMIEKTNQILDESKDFDVSDLKQKIQQMKMIANEDKVKQAVQKDLQTDVFRFKMRKQEVSDAQERSNRLAAKIRNANRSKNYFI